MDSKVGLIIQLNGVFVIAVLCLLLARSLKITALKYWTVAWLCLSFALISLRLGFTYDVIAQLLFTYFYLGEYLFGLLLIAGCKALDGNWEIKPRFEFVIAPFLVLAIALPYISGDFTDTLGVHSVVMSGLFGYAFITLRRSKSRNFGWRVTSVGLAGLSLDFLFFSGSFQINRVFPHYLAAMSFAPAVDLVLQIVLGFGMVIVLLEKVLNETKSAHERLETANQRLEELVQRDPLTAAFSRHAFYGFVQKQGEENTETSGCVGFFDIDDLKLINDTLGHGAGDAAIRHVARSIREIVRAEDLIFRWGGDEFFVIMIGMDAEMAMIRMTRIEQLLTAVSLAGTGEKTDVQVSWGFKDFCDISMLEDAINRADAEMYSRKLERKKRAQSAPPAYMPEFQNSLTV